MKYNHVWVIFGIFVVAGIMSFLYSVPRASEVTEESSLASVSQEAPPVTIKDSFKNGVHSITGSVTAPNACASVSAEAFHEEAETEHARIAIAITLTPYEGICLERATDFNFSASISAPASLPITARVNGVSATTTAL